jgi:hypothetical protein
MIDERDHEQTTDVVSGVVAVFTYHLESSIRATVLAVFTTSPTNP